eukprot:COSAG01_NODE_44463_length_419_cov_0.300000_2_plen_30_part_01
MFEMTETSQPCLATYTMSSALDSIHLSCSV